MADSNPVNPLTNSGTIEARVFSGTPPPRAEGEGTSTPVIPPTSNSPMGKRTLLEVRAAIEQMVGGSHTPTLSDTGITGPSPD